MSKPVVWVNVQFYTYAVTVYWRCVYDEVLFKMAAGQDASLLGRPFTDLMTRSLTTEERLAILASCKTLFKRHSLFLTTPLAKLIALLWQLTKASISVYPDFKLVSTVCEPRLQRFGRSTSSTCRSQAEKALAQDDLARAGAGAEDHVAETTRKSAELRRGMDREDAAHLLHKSAAGGAQEVPNDHGIRSEKKSIAIAEYAFCLNVAAKAFRGRC